jgi:hypothetical protein
MSSSKKKAKNILDINAVSSNDKNERKTKVIGILSHNNNLSDETKSIEVTINTSKENKINKIPIMNNYKSSKIIFIFKIITFLKKILILENIKSENTDLELKELKTKPNLEATRQLSVSSQNKTLLKVSIFN